MNFSSELLWVGLYQLLILAAVFSSVPVIKLPLWAQYLGLYRFQSY